MKNLKIPLVGLGALAFFRMVLVQKKQKIKYGANANNTEVFNFEDVKPQTESLDSNEKPGDKKCIDVDN